VAKYSHNIYSELAKTKIVSYGLLASMTDGVHIIFAGTTVEVTFP